MKITFEQLRAIKNKLPTGSFRRIAKELKISEQTVRNYFEANKFSDGDIADKHIQPGTHSDFVHLEDTSILEAAQRILVESGKGKEKEVKEITKKELAEKIISVAEYFAKESEEKGVKSLPGFKSHEKELHEIAKKLAEIKKKEGVAYAIEPEQFAPVSHSEDVPYRPLLKIETNTPKGTLTIKSPGLGSVEDTIELLTKLENAYNRIFAFESLIKTTPKDVTTNFDLKSLSNLKPTEKHKLQIDKVSFSSPGFWEIIGQLNPLTQIREYLNELHERRKDRKYRNKHEEAKLKEEVKKMKEEVKKMKQDNDHDSQRKELENKLLRNKLMKENIELLKAMGYTKEEIKTLSFEFLINPVIELDKLLEEQQVESFEVVEKDNGSRCNSQTLDIV